MRRPAPKIDPRTAPDIFRQVVDLINQKLEGVNPASDWKAFRPELGASGALIKIFAHFAELITGRLNRVPDKNFLAFLDLLGASLLPPRSARAPLTFSLAEGATGGAVVPAWTEVAAVAVPGEKEPAVFVTESELVVTPARLAASFTRDPASDCYADHSSLLPGSSGVGGREPVFQAATPMEHLLYIAHDKVFAHPGERTALDITLTLSGQDKLITAWEVWDEGRGDWAEKQSGEITSDKAIELKALNPTPIAIEGITKRWLRARLIDRITIGKTLPAVSAMSLRATFERRNRSIERAFTNSFPVDTSRGFYPFGESPLPGDTFFLKIDTDFAEAGCEVTLDLTLNLVGQKPTEENKRDAAVVWRFWDGTAWASFASDKFTDGTANFTKAADKITFTLQASPVLTQVNGVEGHWVSARLETGGYGPAAELKVEKAGDNYTYKSIAAAAPRISSIKIGYSTTLPKEPEAVLAYNDFTYEKIGHTPFTPFKPSPLSWRVAPSNLKGRWRPRTKYVKDDVVGSDGSWWIAKRDNEDITPAKGDDWELVDDPGLKGTWISTTRYVKNDVVSSNGSWWIAKKENTNITPVQGEHWELVDDPPAFLYLGFELPAALGAFPNSRVSLYVSAGVDKESGQRPEVGWEYSTGARWAELNVSDATEGFTRPGLVEFLAPPDFAPRSEFGKSLYWVRAVRRSGRYIAEPQISALLLNTVMAAHATRIENEVLGSSDGSKNQTFRTALAPVLEGERLEVRELEMPSSIELDELRKNAGENAISVIPDEAGRPLAIWVPWKQVADFYGSGPRDRHYVLDHLAGEVRFGDGIGGKVPPAAGGNIRMTSYRTGGGSAANRPAGAITELRTTVAYVDSVTNYVASSGGAEAETTESLVERMPRMIRHGGRAVTYEDYEDLAMAASPDVARARSVRFYENQDAGKVSLIVVPRSKDPRPVPSLEMKRRVQEFIEQGKSPLVKLTVVEPEYVDVGVTVDIAPASLEIANELKLAVLEKITGFLHPLTGGFEGEGWDFGRQPHDSDFYYLIEQIAGVDHVNSLTLAPVAMSETRLIASGKHLVTCTFSLGLRPRPSGQPG